MSWNNIETHPGGVATVANSATTANAPIGIATANTTTTINHTASTPPTTQASTTIHNTAPINPTTTSTSQPESEPQQVPYKPPANNRSILILREIEPTTSESSVREIFNVENCPSRPIHCEYALQNSWYVTFSDDEDARLALAYIRKHIVKWKGKPIMARYKPKPAVPSAANQPPPPPPLPPPLASLPPQMVAGYNPYYGQPGQMIQAPWDLSTVFVYNSLQCPYNKSSVSSVSLVGGAYHHAQDQNIDSRDHHTSDVEQVERKHRRRRRID